jgi:hypothetical protein
MSVIVTLLMKGDPKRLEDHAASSPQDIISIVDNAKEHGVIAHRFYGTDDGQIMVIDEWPDAESFQRFFESNNERIGPLMGAVGVEGQPTISFWRKLETGDDVGWSG